MQSSPMCTPGRMILESPRKQRFADGNGAQASGAGELLGAGIMCDEPYVRSKHAIVPDRHQEAMTGIDEDAVLKGYVGSQHQTAAAQCVEIKENEISRRFATSCRVHRTSGETKRRKVEMAP